MWGTRRDREEEEESNESGAQTDDGTGINKHTRGIIRELRVRQPGDYFCLWRVLVLFCIVGTIWFVCLFVSLELTPLLSLLSVGTSQRGKTNTHTCAHARTVKTGAHACVRAPVPARRLRVPTNIFHFSLFSHFVSPVELFSDPNTFCYPCVRACARSARLSPMKNNPNIFNLFLQCVFLRVCVNAVPHQHAGDQWRWICLLQHERRFDYF